MPDDAAAATGTITRSAGMIAPGDRVLIRDLPLCGPLIVDHVRTLFAGETEPNGPVWARPEDGPRGRPRRYEQREVVPCPTAYESPPSAEEPQLRLRWIERNRALLEAAHGIRAVALAEGRVSRSIILQQRIELGLAAEPEATALRRAEIAIAMSVA